MTDDVLRRVREATARDHERVEATLDLMDAGLDRSRLALAMTTLHSFWRAAERGLEHWAVRHPRDAALVDWAGRRREELYAADLRALGAQPAVEEPELPAVGGTDEALGGMYVLEGSTLGGTVIDRHLASLPSLAGVRLRAFSPYGDRTGAMWHAYRRTTRAHIASGGDADRVVDAACGTFAALAAWVGEASARGSARR